jgi:hypothetical protein
MYPVWVSYSLFFLFALWLGVISYLFWKQHSFLKKFLPSGEEGKDLLDRFSTVLAEVEDFRKRSQLLQKNVKELSIEGLGHIQKVSLLRYNPYGDTGGDQSFTVVLLTGEGDGVTLTSLHTRSGTRVYAKEIKKGKSELHLSVEEEKALHRALREE